MITDPFEELYDTFDENRIMNYFVDKLTGDKLSYRSAVEYTLNYFNSISNEE